MQHEDFLAVFATVFTFMCTVSRVCAGTAAAAKSATNTASLQEQCKAAQRHCSSSAGAGNGNGSLSGMRSLSLTKAAAPGSYIQSTGVHVWLCSVKLECG